MTAELVSVCSSDALVVTVRVPLSMHARPAARLVRLLQAFTADVQLAKNGVRADARSLLDVLSLSIGEGDMIEISVSGADQAAVQEAVSRFFTTAFGE